MGTQRASAGVQQDIWTCGLTLEDFDPPGPATAPPPAPPAARLTSLQLDPSASEAVSTGAGGAEGAELVDFDPAAVAQAWEPQPHDEDEELAERKVLWPQLQPEDYRPSTSPTARIEDNLAAVRLVKALAALPQPIGAEEMRTLLRYSGWGGVSKVFAPDGSAPGPLAKYRDELEQLLGPDDFAAVRRSVNTAFFTPPELAQVMWEMVAALGFKGGRVLEPAAGCGQFFASMPREMAKRSTITAVEVEPVSAAILSAAFAPFGAQVHACELEKAPLPVGFFDLVIGNWPFGDFQSNDTSRAPYANWSIHNWFMGKALELVRPGGLVVALTSRHTMDSASDTHRLFFAAHAQLLGCFRLPTATFEDHAGTEAVTDIIVLQRRMLPDFTNKPVWLATDEAKQELFAAGEPAVKQHWDTNAARSRTLNCTVNAIYNEKPQHVVGRLKWKSSKHGPIALPVIDGGVQAVVDRLNEIVFDDLPSGVYKPAVAAELTAPRSEVSRYANLGNVMPGAFVIMNGRICISEGPELLDVDTLYTGTARKRLLGMLEIRKAASAVIDHQAKSDDDAKLKVLQGHLNRTYDPYVAQYGYLSTSANSRVMRGDPSWPLLLALEIWNEETSTATKADLFNRRTVGVPEVPQFVDSVKDAMLVSLALFGVVDLLDVARRTRKSVQEVTDTFRSEAIAFRDPESGWWLPADEYLSGHIKDKIERAKAAGPAYEINVPALEAVLPQDLGPADVEARMGAPWIPCDVIEAFCGYLVEPSSQQSITVTYEPETATWSVKAGHDRSWVGNHTKQRVEWGTNKRSALDLVEAALNQQPPTITYTVDGKQLVDQSATLAAREKWQAIRDRFRTWVYEDDARRDRLLRLYNDTFNQVVERRYDGAHLHLPGMSTAVKPHPHQKNAIWRVVTRGNTLLAHPVGAGKSLVMIAASMELRRLGKARKVVHVVQGATLEQYAAEFVRLYPQARVLMATKDDLAGERRRAFAARIATGDWDAVVMTHSTFERLHLRPEVMQGFLNEQLQEARAMLALADDAGAKRSIKEIEKRLKEYEAKIKRLAEAKRDSQAVVWWDELGCDWIMYDEAHAAKSLARMSKMPRISGLPNNSSERAFDLYAKTRVLMRARGGEEGVVAATATPISNSLAEMWVMQVLLQPETLKRYGVYEFDAWAATFGEAVTGMELAPDGSGYRIHTRFARFQNAPELLSIFRQVADIQTRSMLKLPTPRIEGDKPQVLVAKPSDVLKEIVAKLVERAEAIRGGGVAPNEDNMLSVTNDGRKAALDVRLLDPSLPADPGSKLVLACDRIAEIWREGADQRWTQLVFSDLGTPGGKFSVYEEMRRLLIERGIPREEIEFVHDHDSDAAKFKLQKRVRDGQVRVVFGSTQKLGTGVNVQKRLKAIWHMDCPWRPSDIEQRDGRANRQGNQCESIWLYRVVTEGSFDAYSWNLIDVKARFIEQVMNADKGMRSVEDVSLTSLSYAEIKAIASGNPLVLEKATVDAKVQKLAFAFSQWEEDRWRLSNRKGQLTSRVGWIERILPDVEKDAQAAAKVFPEPALLPGSSVATAASQGLATAEGIGRAFRSMANTGVTGLLGTVEGFEVHVDRPMLGSWRLRVKAPVSGLMAEVERPSMHEMSAVGRACLDSIRRVAGDPALLRAEHARKCEEIAGIELLLKQDFAQRDELAQARARQAQIENELDLNKSTAGTAALSAEAQD